MTDSTLRQFVETGQVDSGNVDRISPALSTTAWWCFKLRYRLLRNIVHQAYTRLGLIHDHAPHLARPSLQAGVNDVAQVIENIQAGLMKDVQDIHHDPVVDDFSGAVSAVPISHAHLHAFS